MSCCGKGKLVTFELKDRRLITLDLDCDEEWGEIHIERGSRIGSEKVFIGGEEDNRVEAVRFWEEVDRDGTELDSISKYHQTFTEVSKDDVIEWVLIRLICFSDGFTIKDLKDSLAYYGFDIDKIYIPKEWYE